MAKGKYAARADRTRDISDVQRENAELRNDVRSLSKELLAANRSVVEERVVHASRVADLHSQIAAGTSDELEAARSEIKSLRDELGEVKTSYKDASDKWGKASRKVSEYIASTSKLSRLEAYELMLEWFGYEDSVINHDGLRPGLAPDKAVVIQRAAGLRK